MPRIEALSLPQETETFTPPTTSSLFTVAKMKRALCYFLSAITGIGATLVMGFAFTKTFLPLSAGLGGIPLVLLAFYFGWQGARIYDYSDPIELSLIQEEALHKPLLDLASRHSWKNLFLYQILSPPAFSYAFRQNAENIDITGLVLMRKKAGEGLDAANIAAGMGQLLKYSIPGLKRYRERFHQETKSLPCVEILKKYPIDDLAKYQVISDEEAEILFKLREQYEAAKAQCKTQIDYSEKEFRNNTASSRLLTTAGQFVGHEYVAIASRRRARDPFRFRDFSRHLGVEMLGDSAFNALTAQERDHRLAATAFHGDQFKQRLKNINDQYVAYRKERGLPYLGSPQ
ncbi:MAG TPA: hypothetical protein VLG44_03105 [Chlamydiales bacterium]|nr:hypothetical protein [Chlamydiales bacterium]